MDLEIDAHDRAEHSDERMREMKQTGPVDARCNYVIRNSCDEGAGVAMVRGRPARAGEAATVMVTFRLTTRERAELQALARLRGTTRSDLLRTWLAVARAEIAPPPSTKRTGGAVSTKQPQPPVSSRRVMPKSGR
jgi:hypothetical protein